LKESKGKLGFIRGRARRVGRVDGQNQVIRWSVLQWGNAEVGVVRDGVRR